MARPPVIDLGEPIEVDRDVIEKITAARTSFLDFGEDGAAARVPPSTRPEAAAVREVPYPRRALPFRPFWAIGLLVLALTALTALLSFDQYAANPAAASALSDTAATVLPFIVAAGLMAAAFHLSPALSLLVSTGMGLYIAANADRIAAILGP